MIITKKPTKIQVLIWIMQAWLATAALNICVRVVPDDGTESALVANMLKFRESFSGDVAAHMAIIIAFLCAIYLLYLAGAKCTGRLNIIAGVFAVIYVLDLSIVKTGTTDFVFANGFQRCLSLLCMCGWWVIFRMLLAGIAFAAEKTAPESREKIDMLNFRKIWCVSFAVIFICWLPWLFASYPCSFCPDSINSLEQYFGFRPWNGNSPVLNTLIMGVFASLGGAIKTRAFGCFLYVFTQAAIGAAIFAYTAVILRKMGMGRGGYIAVMLFYAVLPLWGAYVQWFEKDMMYVEFYTLSMTALAFVMYKRSCTAGEAILLTCALLMMSLLRNNGRYEMLPFVLLLCVYLKGVDRKRLSAVVAVVAAVVIGLTSFVYPKLGIEKAPVSEVLSIPLQQTARYIVFCGDEVTEEEHTAIEAVIDYDSVAEKYRPYYSDPIKDSYHGDGDSLRNYLRVWLKMGMKHPQIYLDGFLHQNSGFIAPVNAGGEPDIALNTYIEDAPHLEITRSSDVIPTLVFDNWWHMFFTLPGFNMLISAGLYIWMVVVCVALMRDKKRNSALILLIPALLNIVSCIFSALSGGVRYALPLIATAPLILWWTALNTTSCNN